MSGTLRAERDSSGLTVTFHMEYADPEDHIFAVERYDGTANTDNGETVEVWTPIRSGQAKFVDGDTDYERSLSSHWEDGEGFVFEPLVFPRKYRAKAYRRIELDDANSRILQGQDSYTAIVTVK